MAMIASNSFAEGSLPDSTSMAAAMVRPNESAKYEKPSWNVTSSRQERPASASSP